MNDDDVREAVRHIEAWINVRLIGFGAGVLILLFMNVGNAPNPLSYLHSASAWAGVTLGGLVGLALSFYDYRRVCRHSGEYAAIRRADIRRHRELTFSAQWEYLALSSGWLTFTDGMVHLMPVLVAFLFGFRIAIFACFTSAISEWLTWRIRWRPRFSC